MIESITRIPQIEIEIRRPNVNSTNYLDELIVVFGMLDSQGQSTACIGYEFSENINSPDSDFQLTLTLEKDKNGKTWYDKLQKRDLVFIKEYGKLSFIGYINSRRYQSRMSDKGPQRVITISGKNIGGLLMYFSVVIDLHILSANRTSQSESQQFMTAISSELDVNQNLGNLLKQIKDAFFKLMDAMGGSQNKGLKVILDEFLDFENGLSSELVSQYPTALSLFQMGENNLWNIMSSMLNPPFHEFFGRFVSDPSDNKSKFQAVLRPTPFDPSRWIQLPITKIPEDLPAVFLVDYDIGDTDSEVKTMFGCLLPGSNIGLEKALTLDDYALSMKQDLSKWPMYGYKPMISELKFFDRSKESEWKETSKLMTDLGQTLYDWFHNNADFITGTVTLMTYQSSNYTKFPKLGERLGFLGGEFYIEDLHRSWQYGGAHTTTLSISRGYIYSETGEQYKPIDQIGQKVGVLEKENG